MYYNFIIIHPLPLILLHAYVSTCVPLVAVLSLGLQNGLLVLCSIVMAVMFYYDLNVCLHLMVFIPLVAMVILLASGANLATVANTISIEKDWVVVIADGNEDTLAGMCIVVV